MLRPFCLVLSLGLLAASPAMAQARRGDGSPPWSALTSSSAALKVAFDEVCLTAVLEQRPIADLAAARYLRPVNPRSTGSAQATEAWRLASWSAVYVMALPNGGCSVSMDAGNAEALRAEAVALMTARGAFAEGPTHPMRDGQAENAAWCSPEADRPIVIGLIRKLSGRGPALLANVFRAQGARPAFCPPT